MSNLEYLDLTFCNNLEEVHDSLRYSRKLIRLSLSYCKNLMRFPYMNVESLEYVYLQGCSSLEKFPEILGRMKLELENDKRCSETMELPSLDLFGLVNLVALPSSICTCKSLVILNLVGCKKLESLPEQIGNLVNLEKINAKFTLISRPPPSIICLTKLKFLSFEKSISAEGQDAAYFVFPQVNEGLGSLKHLNLSYCNLIDGGLPDDIGGLSSLEVLHLRGNNFEHLPPSIAQLGSLGLLDLTACKGLTELPELPPNIDTLHADFEVALKSIHSLATKCKKLQTVLFKTLLYGFNYSEADGIFAESLFRYISALDSLCQRMIYIVHPCRKIPSWFPNEGIYANSLFVSLPGNWYVNKNLLGIAICCSGICNEVLIELLPLSNTTSLCVWDTRAKPERLSKKLASTYPSDVEGMHFFFIPLVSLWDTFKTNGATPNEYVYLKFSTTGVMKFGSRLLYKDEPDFDTLSGMRENGDKSTEFCIGT